MVVLGEDQLGRQVDIVVNRLTSHKLFFVIG